MGMALWPMPETGCGAATTAGIAALDPISKPALRNPTQQRRPLRFMSIGIQLSVASVLKAIPGVSTRAADVLRCESASTAEALTPAASKD